MAETQTRQAIAFKLRDAMQRQGLSQEKLADLSGVNQSFISRVLTTDVLVWYGNPQVVRKLKRLATTLGLSPDALLIGNPGKGTVDSFPVVCRNKRMMMGITVRELARLSGVPSGTIGRFETDPGYNPSYAIMRAIAAPLGLADQAKGGQGEDDNEADSEVAAVAG